MRFNRVVLVFDRMRRRGLHTMQLTLAQAARLTGTSKATLSRAIKAGRLSATRRNDGYGSYSIGSQRTRPRL